MKIFDFQMKFLVAFVACAMVAAWFWTGTGPLLAPSEAASLRGGDTDSEVKCDRSRMETNCATDGACALSFNDKKKQCSGNCKFVCTDNTSVYYNTYTPGKTWKIDKTQDTVYLCGQFDLGNFNCALNAKKDACECQGVAGLPGNLCKRSAPVNDPCS